MDGAIRAWGIEIEAGWKYDLNAHYTINNRNPLLYRRMLQFKPDTFPEMPVPPKNKWSLHNDGSIYTDNLFSHEIVIFPPAKSRESLVKDITKLWNLIGEVNDSMGLHIHISLSDTNYAKLATWKYVNQFQIAVSNKFPEVRTRIGYNSFCERYNNKESFLIHAIIQIPSSYKSSSRHHILNFSYGLHGTVEYRAFPMVERLSRAKKYLEFVDANVNSFLEHCELNKEDYIVDIDTLKTYTPPAARRRRRSR